MEIDVIDLDLTNLEEDYKYEETRRYQRGLELYNNKKVTISKVDKADYNAYNITATVRGHAGNYSVNLKIFENSIICCTCSCEDYSSSPYDYCKHGIATILECRNPHIASTSDGMLRLFEKKRKVMLKSQKEHKENEDKIKEYEKKKQEAIERLKYQEKYEIALQVMNSSNRYSSNYNSSVKKDGEKTPKDYYEEIAQNKGVTPTYNLNTNIEIVPYFESSYWYKKSPDKITFKIGETTMYKLKDLSDFYKAYVYGEVLNYGKKLNFIPKRENFATNSQKLFDFIINCGKVLNMQGDNRYSRDYGSAITNKEIRISGDTIQDFMDALGDNELIVSLEEDSVYTFTDSKYIPKVTLEKNSDKDFLLEIDRDYDFIFFSLNYVYIFYKNKIYKNSYSTEELDVIDLIENMHRRGQDSFLIPIDKMNEFFCDLYPNWLNEIDYSSCEKEIDSLVTNNKLSSKMYLDLDDDNNITLKVVFCYGDVEKNIFDSDYNKFMKDNNISRNLNSEKSVISELYADGFIIDEKNKRFVMQDDDKSYEFLSEKIEKYMNDFEVLASENFRSKEVKKPKFSNVSIKLDNGLLELDLSNINYDLDELKKVLESYSLKKKYYKLKSGEFLSLEKSEDLDFLEDIEDGVGIDFKNIKNGKVKVPVMRGIYLEKLLENTKIPSEKNKEFNSFINGFENKENEEYKIDDKLQNVLRNYQKKGFEWLKGLENYEFGGILADDMGLRKITSNYYFTIVVL